MRTNKTRRVLLALAVAVGAASCSADQLVEPGARLEDGQQGQFSTQQDTTGKSGVGTLGSGNRESNTTSTADGGVGTLGSGN
jgi:hypothetical protein